MVYKGRRVAGPLFAHMRFYCTCVTRIAKLDQVCEIGGGFGAPARLFLTNSYRRPHSYVIVDLPKSLSFAECYLRATLGNDRVRYVGDAVGALPEGTAILVPSHGSRPCGRSPSISSSTRCRWPRCRTATCHSIETGWLNRLWITSIRSTVSSSAPGRKRKPVCAATVGEVGSHLVELRAGGAELVPASAGRADIIRSGHAAHHRSPARPAAMYALLHAAANCDDTRVLLQLASAMVEDFDPPPKEALFLCRRIEGLEPAGAALTTSELARVAQIVAAIEGRFANSERDCVPHHLIEMQRTLYPTVVAE